MQQFEHNGILYEELPDGKARVIGPAGQAAPMQQPPAFVPPSPNSPRAQERAQEQAMDQQRLQHDATRVQMDQQRFSLDQQKFAREQQEQADKLRAKEEGKSRGADKARIVIGTVDRALQNTGGWTTGIPGAVGQAIPGTTAKDLNSQLTTIKANLGFEELQAMRAASPTGGALGQVAVQELVALQATLGNLDQAQSADELRRNLEQIKQHYTNWFKATYGASPQGEGLSDEQAQAELKQRIAGGADPAETIQWLIDSGRPPDKDTIAAIIANANNPRPDVRPPEGPSDRTQERLSNSGGGEAVVAGALDTLTFGTFDEISGFADALFEGGSVRDNIAANREYLNTLQQRHPTSHLGGQVGGAVAVPFGLGARGAQQLAKVGAVQGGAYGAGSGEGIQGRATGAAIGAGAGAATGYALGAAGQYGGRAVNSLLKRGPDPRLEAAEGAQALNINLMPADVGGPATRTATAATAQTFLGAGPIVRSAERSVQNAADARSRIAGDVLPTDEAGEAVRKGGQRFVDVTGKRGGRLYDRVAKMTGGEKLPTPNATSVIDQHISELSEAGELAAPMIKELEKVKRSIGEGATVNGLRRARTLLRGLAQSDALRGTDAGRVFGQVLDAVSADIQAGLRSTGKAGAADMLRTADRFWRERVEEIDQVLEPIIGKGKSGEDIVRAVEGMTQGRRGGVQRLSRLMAALPEEEAAGVRATLINRLGRAGRDAGEGDNFSPNHFMTQWDAMSSKAKGVVFGNTELRKSLDQLASVARQMKAADRYRNFSNTGGAVANIASGAGAATGIATGNVAAVVGLAALNYASAKLLSSPAFVRALTGILRMKGDPQRALGRLSEVGTKTPALRNEITQLVARVANDNTALRSVASDGNPEEQQ